jgi:outer membrane biosynthesis protein TonB
MSTTEIPPTPEVAEEVIPHFLMELQDDLARSRLREAFWISLIIHLILVVALATAPKYIRFTPDVVVRSPQEMVANQELTYLDLPKDRQQTVRKPETNIISDKDRVAVSKNPTIDKKTLQQLRAMRPGPPGPPQPLQQPSPQVPPSQQMTQQAQPTPTQQQPSTMAMARPTPTVPQPKLETLPETKPTPPKSFKLPASAAIDQAMRAAAAGRAAGYGGSGGDYGVGFGNPQRQVLGGAEILSDTMGVDFAPYLSRIQQTINRNWQTIIPEAAMPPLMKRGKVVVEFAITKDGKIAGMRIPNGGQSGDVSLDRAAWGGITASNPFPPLPTDFHGDYIAIRCYFYYNPDKNEFSSR